MLGKCTTLNLLLIVKDVFGVKAPFFHKFWSMPGQHRLDSKHAGNIQDYRIHTLFRECMARCHVLHCPPEVSRVCVTGSLWRMLWGCVQSHGVQVLLLSEVSRDLTSNQTLRVKCLLLSEVSGDLTSNQALTWVQCLLLSEVSRDLTSNQALTWVQCLLLSEVSRDLTSNQALTRVQYLLLSEASRDLTSNQALTRVQCLLLSEASRDLTSNQALTRVQGCYSQKFLET